MSKPIIDSWVVTLKTVEGIEITLDGDNLTDSTTQQIDEAIKQDGFPCSWEEE